MRKAVARLFPARAGVIPIAELYRLAAMALPRASGGNSLLAGKGKAAGVSSPRKRG